MDVPALGQTTGWQIRVVQPTIVAAISWPEAIRNRQKPTKKKWFRSRHNGGTHNFRNGRQRKLTVPEHDVLLQLVVALLSYCNHW